MRVKSKLISLVLALTLLIGSIGTVGYASAFSDVESSRNYSGAVSLLAALKLLEGYEDGTFRPDGDITRAEFATVVVRALGQGESAISAAGQTQFNDVAADFWGSGYINVASTLGIVNGYGDGNFGPNDKVTYEQAVKMMVCALGYEALALDNVGNDVNAVWPQGYLRAATQVNILSGVSGVEGVDAKRWQVARLVYNSLEVNVMEKVVQHGEDRHLIRDGKTLLGDRLSVYISNGNFRANSTASVSQSGVRARAGEVIIYDNNIGAEETFMDGGLNTSSLVGRAVKYYYTETLDGIKTLVYIEDRTNTSEIITIDASDIESVTGSYGSGFEFKYWEDQTVDTRAKTVVTAETPTVMFNGAVLSTSDINVAHLWPLSGSVELIDSDRSGKFDNILITSYETFYVRSVNSTTKVIVDEYRNSSEDNTLTINEDNSQLTVTIKRPEGTTIAFSNIAKGNVLSVKQSKSTGRNTMEVIVSNKTVSGTITTVDDTESIAIDGKDYKVSQYYINYGIRNDSSKNFEVGASGVFYLDKDDRIAGYERTASTRSNYGYLLGTTRSSSRITMEMLTINGGVETLNAASRLRIDNEVKQNDEVFDYLYNTSRDSRINVDGATLPSDYTPQLVRYSVNASGEVTTIDTINSRDLNVYDENKEMTYNSSVNDFKAGDSRIRINSSTRVFVIPKDRTQSENYASRLHTTSNQYFENGRSYFVEGYDEADVTSGTGISAAIVVYDDGIVELNSTSPIAIVKGISQIATSGDYDGQIKAVVFGNGRSAGTESTVPARYSDITSKGLKVGDVFRYATDNKGNVQIMQVVATPNTEIISKITDNYDYNDITLEFFNGMVYGVDIDESRYTFLLTTTSSIESYDTTFSTDSNTKVYYYNTDGNDKKVESVENNFIDSLVKYADTKGTANPEASKVAVFILKDGSRTIQSFVYVVKR